MEESIGRDLVESGNRLLWLFALLAGTLGLLLTNIIIVCVVLRNDVSSKQGLNRGQPGTQRLIVNIFKGQEISCLNICVNNFNI